MTRIFNPPKAIYLNVGDLHEDVDFKDLHELTWSSEPIGKNDIKYIIVEAPEAPNSKNKITKEVVKAASEWSINYLNAKTGSKYRANNRKTLGHIKARLEEGFVGKDFKRVIDNRLSHWKDDPEMEQYLRPMTLFGTKFESYLNSKDKPKKENVHENDTREVCQYITSYLNSETGSSFKPFEQHTLSAAVSVLEQGFSMKDVQKVVVKKVKEWKGTEMQKNLQPYILLGKKFSAYLEQPEIETKDNAPKSVTLKIGEHNR